MSLLLTTTLGFKLPAKTPPSGSKRSSYTSCQSQNGSADDKHHLVDRRNILIGLTGVCGASTTLGNVAVADPIKPVDLSKCHFALDEFIPDGPHLVQCCPPDFSNMPIKDFKLPESPQCLRIRSPAHKLSNEYKEKYKTAIQKMKALPEDDPWNFYQQAQIHCQYCNDAYDQVGSPTVPLRVHHSYIFLPWHRFYVYFWEKILGKLIGDETFAIPYWNWDAEEGMKMPDLYYLDKSSPLYNINRNKAHYSALLDFNYKKGDPNPPDSQHNIIVTRNLNRLQRIFKEGKGDPSLFMGSPLSKGEVQGTMEGLHNVHHQWVGSLEKPYWDMGNFHTAAQDTLFWAHHANVDRMWNLYSTSRGNKPEFGYDWLDSSFIFYDENKELVKCKVRDSLAIDKLGYTYQQQPTPWLRFGKKYRNQRKATKRSAGGDESVTQVAEFGSETRALDTTIRALVKRPKVDLTSDDKEDVTEVVIVDGIMIEDETEHIRFDVYIAKPNEGLVSADLGEFAGSFVSVSHNSMSKSEKGKTLRLGITYLVGDIEADSSENLVVTLVPRTGIVKIGGVAIDLVTNPEP